MLSRAFDSDADRAQRARRSSCADSACGVGAIRTSRSNTRSACSARARGRAAARPAGRATGSVPLAATDGDRRPASRASRGAARGDSSAGVAGPARRGRSRPRRTAPSDAPRPSSTRHRVADLAIAVRLGARRTGSQSGKRLHPRRLADRQRPVLLGVDVPVAVLGDVRGDRAAQLIPGEALVLVGEDVGAVAAEVAPGGRCTSGPLRAVGTPRMSSARTSRQMCSGIDVRVAAGTSRRMQSLERASVCGAASYGESLARAARAGSAGRSPIASRSVDSVDRHGSRPQRLDAALRRPMRIRRCRCCGTPWRKPSRIRASTRYPSSRSDS